MLYICLGHDVSKDLRAPLRASEGIDLLSDTNLEAISRKPKEHDILIDRSTKLPAVTQHMSVTGG